LLTDSCVELLQRFKKIMRIHKSVGTSHLDLTRKTVGSGWSKVKSMGSRSQMQKFMDIG